MLSIDVLAHAIFETAKISIPAVRRARKGALTAGYCDEQLRDWARRLLNFASVRLQVSGLEHLEGLGKSVVVMSNHQSVYDIPVWFAALPLSLRMAAKAELFRTPVWGRAMQEAGFVKIDRADPESAQRSLALAGERMRRQGLSLCIAPEGTRSRDGQVHRFKRGGFLFAQATGFPIVPVALEGTRAILAKGDTEVHRGKTVRLTVLPPLVHPDFQQLELLRESVRQSIADVISSGGLPD